MAQHGVLRRLMDLCDEIRALRRKLHDPALKTETVTRLKRRSREKLRRLAVDLSTCEFKGSLGHLIQDLEPRHFLLLATLLRRYLRATTPFVEGRALLSAVFDSSYELLEGLELLQPDGVLRRGELILVAHDEDATGEPDLLECRFRLADAVVDAFLEELGLRAQPFAPRRAGSVAESGELQPYANQEEYLVDLKILHNLYQARAKRLFSPESWWRLRGSAGDRAHRAVERRIARVEARIQQRLESSPHAAEFPLQRLIIEHGMTRAELLIVLHLLFLELLEGNPYADVVALLQLVSGSEEELIDNRRLFASRGLLRSTGIVDLDQMIDGRELTSECHLANWATERILGEAGERGPIDADERLNFHIYLKRLGTSKFLEDV